MTHWSEYFWPTSNSTVTPISACSMVHPIRRNWSLTPPNWDGALALTDHDAVYGIPRFVEARTQLESSPSSARK